MERYRIEYEGRVFSGLTEYPFSLLAQNAPSSFRDYETAKSVAEAIADKYSIPIEKLDVVQELTLDQ